MRSEGSSYYPWILEQEDHGGHAHQEEQKVHEPWLWLAPITSMESSHWPHLNFNLIHFYTCSFMSPSLIFLSLLLTYSSLIQLTKAYTAKMSSVIESMLCPALKILFHFSNPCQSHFSSCDLKRSKIDKDSRQCQPTASYAFGLPACPLPIWIPTVSWVCGLHPSYYVSQSPHYHPLHNCFHSFYVGCITKLCNH